MEYFDTVLYKYQCIKNSIKNIEIDNDFAYAWNSKGYSIIYYLKYDNKLEVESVLNYFRKAIELRPDFAYPYCQIRFHFFESWKIQSEAVECFDKAIELRPDFAYAWYNKGYALNYKGKYSEAVECFDKAI